MAEKDSWNEWSRYVLKELERLDKAISKGEESDREVKEKLEEQVNVVREAILQKVDTLEKELLVLKVKAGLLGGGIGGGLGVISVIINHFTSG